MSVAAKRPAGVREFLLQARRIRARVAGIAIIAFMANSDGAAGPVKLVMLAIAGAVRDGGFELGLVKVCAADVKKDVFRTSAGELWLPCTIIGLADREKTTARVSAKGEEKKSLNMRQITYIMLMQRLLLSTHYLGYIGQFRDWLRLHSSPCTTSRGSMTTSASVLWYHRNVGLAFYGLR